MRQGAWAAAFAFIFNETLTKLMHYGPVLKLVTMEVHDDGGATVTGEIGPHTDPLTDFTQQYVIPFMTKAYSFIAGACVTVETGSPAAGVMTYNALDVGSSLLAGSSADFPLPRNMSIPGAFNPPNAW